MTVFDSQDLYPVTHNPLCVVPPKIHPRYEYALLPNVKYIVGERSPGAHVAPPTHHLAVVKAAVDVTWQSCEIPCPIDCQLTAWAQWSPCRKSCESDGSRTGGGSGIGPSIPSPSTVIMDTQSRSRSVLQWPKDEGKGCPSRLEIRPCPLLASSCSSLRWSSEPWSNCSLPSGKMCGDGVRSRGLLCTKAGVEVNKSECFKNALLLPIQGESCSVVCHRSRKKKKWERSCVLAAWSSWSDCSVGCPSMRRRFRIGSNKRDEGHKSTNPCTNSTFYNSEETENCPCMNYTTRAVGPWSECILEHDLNDDDTGTLNKDKGSFLSRKNERSPSNKICGVGHRYQRLECYDENYFMSDMKYCGGKAFIEKSCIVVCPMDCHMSPWSDWGLCDSNCGPGLKNRTSKILRLPTEGGRPCPGPTAEYSTCNYPCENFRWHSGPWSECLISGGSTCGEGIKQRSVRCVQDAEDNKDSSTSVPDEFCDQEDKPSERESCHLFCSGECAYSEWSGWSECNTGSSSSNGASNNSRRKRKPKTSKSCGRQKRTRTILRSGSTPCPKITRESRPCPHCRSSYSWALTPWSSCRPFGDSGCGEGRQYRGIRCVRNEDGRSVKEKHCSRPKRELELSTWCSVDCPVDCEVSEWSTWNEERCDCGPGAKNRSRTRVITTPGTHSGRPCPLKLMETKSCPAIPCYDWHRTSWTCDMQGASCGVGVARRNVSCVRSSYSAYPNSHIRYASRIPSDFKVSPQFCTTSIIAKSAHKSGEDSERPSILLESNLNRRVLDLHEEDVCSISCPGDCEVSEWSPWSKCQSNCIVGSRTRTRRIIEPPKLPHGKCTTDLTDDQSCAADACFSFSWKTMKNGRQECVRSDGKILRDGCHRGDCDPPCNAPHSECGPGLICRCYPGYRPQYLPPPILSSRPPKLIACIKMEGNSSGISYSSSSSSSQILASDVMMKSESSSLPDGQNEIIDFKYFPDDSQLNYWMFCYDCYWMCFSLLLLVFLFISCANPQIVKVGRE
ncbi:unnamed protein product [Lepeophtheirus salmonis]|uniref:(salmon louse) hypothetical protein n=1 Tax=Lepeophtheirus salmonis TaxID=72036 RepID=A0A7R8H188_LEPSM|nr:unnamed protein product [Lepeophtheirus salmonis]CAF2802708.1 unnamed protein product [Lepeophtheirus salmonis]